METLGLNLRESKLILENVQDFMVAQHVEFMSDGGEDVRQVQTYLHPGSEHWIDWFHITMRITVLQQRTKSLQGEGNRSETASRMSKQIDVSSSSSKCNGP